MDAGIVLWYMNVIEVLLLSHLVLKHVSIFLLDGYLCPILVYVWLVILMGNNINMPKFQSQGI